jgi:uncharacterized protein
MKSAIFIPSSEGIVVRLRVNPGARGNDIVGIYGEGRTARLKIAVQAPAVEGRANQALAALLAEVFSVQRSRVELTAGARSRSKAFLVRGATLKQAETILAKIAK